MAWRYGQAAPKAVIARTPAFHAHLKNVNSARGFRAGQGIRSLPIREVGLKDRVQDSEPCLRLRFVLIFANLETLIDVNNRSEEHTSELQSPYVIPYAFF